MLLRQDWGFFEAWRHDIDYRKMSLCQMLQGGANRKLILASVLSSVIQTRKDCDVVDMCDMNDML